MTDDACEDRLKLLSDGTRLEVLRQLLGGARRVSEIQEALGVEQSLLSHHLRVLREADLVRAERDGKAMLYRLAPGVSPKRGSNVINLGCCSLSFPSARR